MLGKTSAAILSSLYPYWGGTQYHVLGAPWCKKFTPYRSMSSTCQLHTNKLSELEIRSPFKISKEMLTGSHQKKMVENTTPPFTL
jgi:hypothetical protein